MTDKAVLCGINRYKSISGLKGCLNDLEGVQRLLIDNFQFPAANVRVHRDEEVTKRTIKKAFDWLANGAGLGDRLVFHYSGHGSYTKSKTPDKDVDELLCLFDMQWSNEDSFLRDTDLGALTRKIPASATLTVILDSCHSGTGTKAFTSNFKSAARSITPKSSLVIVADTAARLAMQQPGVRATQLATGIAAARKAELKQLRSEDSPPVFARFVEPPTEILQAIADVPEPRKRSLGQMMRSTLNHQLLAAASDKQTAADAYIDGQYRGAFSFNLCATIRLNADKSYAEIMCVTQQRIQRQGFSQEPQMDGPFTDSVVFGSNKPVATPAPVPPTSPVFADPNSAEPVLTGPVPCGCSHESIERIESIDHAESSAPRFGKTCRPGCFVTSPSRSFKRRDTAPRNI
jgi:metacaspase-1